MPAALGGAAVGDHLHGVRDVGELAAEKVGEIVTPRRDDEEQSRLAGH